jgi:cytochrome P450
MHAASERLLKQKLKLPPKVTGPGTGVALRLWGDPLAHLNRLAQISEDVVFFHLAGERVYLVKDPALIHEVLVTKNRYFKKGRSLERGRHIFGNGLLASEGNFYLRHRRLMQPAFHSQRISGFAETMTGHANRLMAQWHDGETCDLYVEMMRLTLGVVSEALLGADIDTEAAKVREAMTTLMRNFPFLMLPFGLALKRLPLPMMKRLRQAQGELDDILSRLIKRRRREAIDRPDLLSMLLAAQDPEAVTGEGMTDQEVLDEVKNVFLAGYETTSAAFCWTWYLLSQHPEIEARLHAEIDQVLTQEHSPGVGDLPKLGYTRNIVIESMRLYPPVWMITRRALEPCRIGSYDVPAETLVQMSQWIMHRDPRYFEEPTEFRPERWTPEFQAALPKFVYFPFGGGMRECIGEGFALMELVLVVAAIARRWRFRVSDIGKVVPDPVFALRLKNGLPVTIFRRRCIVE